MTSTNETKVTEGKPECALPPREQELAQPEKRTRTTPPYIQTPTDEATFNLYQEHRKALGETWTAYILTALALRKETLEKRAQWREQKRKQAQNKKAEGEASQPLEVKEG
jgi:hypothetical protein